MGWTRLHVMHGRPPLPAFSVGERVSFISRFGLSPGTPIAFTIITVLPGDDGRPQYRIRSTEEPFFRISPESNLTAAVQCEPDHEEARQMWRARFARKPKR